MAGLLFGEGFFLPSLSSQNVEKVSVLYLDSRTTIIMCCRRVPTDVRMALNFLLQTISWCDVILLPLVILRLPLL